LYLYFFYLDMESFNMDLEINRFSCTQFSFRCRKTVFFSIVLFCTLLFLEAYVTILYASHKHEKNQCNTSLLYLTQPENISTSDSIKNITSTSASNISYSEGNLTSNCSKLLLIFPTFISQPPIPPK
jgi:hypothetical protein